MRDVWIKKYAAMICWILWGWNIGGRIIRTQRLSGNAGKCITQLKDAAHADNLVDAISLVDPKAKPSEENDKKIREFVEKLLKGKENGYDDN